MAMPYNSLIEKIQNPGNQVAVVKKEANAAQGSIFAMEPFAARKEQTIPARTETIRKTVPVEIQFQKVTSPTTVQFETKIANDKKFESDLNKLVSVEDREDNLEDLDSDDSESDVES